MAMRREGGAGAVTPLRKPSPAVKSNGGLQFGLIAVDQNLESARRGRL